MDFGNLTLKNYLRSLCGKKPVPGGGSASALAGASGVALILKAIAFTSSDSKVKNKLSRYTVELKKIFSKLSDAITQDSRAYAEVISALKLPRSTPRETALRNKKLRNSLVMSSEVSRGVVFNSKKALKISYEIESYLNKNFISDIACARNLLKSAVSSSEIFFNENLKCADRISKK